MKLNAFQLSSSSLASMFTVLGVFFLVNVFLVMAAPWDGNSRTSDESEDKWIAKQGDGPIESALLPGLFGELTDRTLANTLRRNRLNAAKFEQQKRQMRYHQCYFNPISCFKKRK